VDSNYSISSQTGTLTITPALLTVTADNKSSEYSDPSPAVRFTITGFVNAHVSSVLIKQPTFSQGGAHRITCSGAAAAKCEIAYVSGVSTVTQEPAASNTPEIRRANRASLTLQATVSDSVPDSTIGDITKI
jgi:hypothetical protein